MTRTSVGPLTIPFAPILALSLSIACSATQDQQADLAVINARVWTGDPAQAWAEAVASRGDRIVAVGSETEVRAWIGPDTRIIDAKGGMVAPGFIDCHLHFLSGGFNLASVQLRDASTPQEFIRRIQEFVENSSPGAWIRGGDWDHQNWGGQLPTRDWIDAVSPDNPVAVNRLDGHMLLANSLALRLAGIDEGTEAPEGGEIVRDPQGIPTGILKDNAMPLLLEAVPAPDPWQVDQALEAAMRYVAAQGVTSVHDMGDFESQDAYRRARREGRLKTRIYSVVPLPEWEKLRRRVEAEGIGDEWLRIGGLKGFVDGSLGSHTAAFVEPFTDAPGDRGLLVNSEADLQQWIEGADKAGLHVIVHAIGDRANRLLLGIYQRVEDANGPRDRRFRIEHAQHLAAQEIRAFAELAVIPSMQPYHAIDDGRWAEKVIGPERIRTTYAFRSLLDEGAALAFGSDWPVAPATPLEGLYAAVTRRTLDGDHPEGWVPEQKVGVEEALTAYTRSAAYASFEQDLKGTLTVGKLADFVWIDRNLLELAGEEIRQARILMTVVGGRIVHSAEGGPQD